MGTPAGPYFLGLILEISAAIAKIDTGTNCREVAEIGNVQK
jgi:hypothetical protein